MGMWWGFTGGFGKSGFKERKRGKRHGGYVIYKEINEYKQGLILGDKRVFGGY